MSSGNAGLLVVDVQDRLFPHMDGGARVLERIGILVQAAQELDVPVVVTEQYVKGLGRTVPKLQEVLGKGYDPIEKVAFSCFSDTAAKKRIRAQNRTHWVVCGIEAHVCVMQSVLELLEQNDRVYVPVDAVTSRNPIDRDTAVSRLPSEGAIPTTTESVVFEWLGTADRPEFKRVQSLIK